MERDLLRELKIKQGIRKFVPLVNAEIGRDDCNDFSIAYFEALIDKAYFLITDDWYLVALPVKNMWGDVTLEVISFYVLPLLRSNPIYLRKILKSLGVFAKMSGARYIEIGSHLNEKLHSFLARQGYKVSCLKRSV